MAAKTTITKTTKTKKTPPTTGKPPTTESLGARLTRASDLTYAQRLAMKATPTTLYEAASQTGFLISSYGAAFFCMGSAAVNSYFNVYNLPPGISPWVPTGFAVIGFVFATLGTVFALRPSSMIKSIKLLPIPSSQLQGTGPIPRTVMLEVAARRISPIPLPLKRFQVRPEQIVLVNRMSNRPVVPSERERMLKQSEDAKRRKEEREYELDHLMTAPFRDAGRASSTIFSNIRRGLTGEGFAPVFIDGVQYKLDADNGYALDDGLVLDRLVRIEPDRQLARSQSEKKE
ncbi:hypothetical protein NPX13_g642 [Xylaria arbuscula]|uniref:Uncharacterized protein n=1 Tax=Xylaria arbuscula TaxID=114810 RepID=A0A9W8NP04_9PEZI|nr:hypothetical protein NPX13_g642 [Xylaria arbuscula]